MSHAHVGATYLLFVHSTVAIVRQVCRRQHLAQLLLLVQDFLAQLLLLPLVILDLAERCLQAGGLRAKGFAQLVQLADNGGSGIANLCVSTNSSSEVHLVAKGEYTRTQNTNAGAINIIDSDRPHGPRPKYTCNFSTDMLIFVF